MPAHAAALASVLVAMATQINSGHYTPVALTLVLAALGVLIAGARQIFLPATSRLHPTQVAEGALAFAVILLGAAGIMRRPLAFATVEWFTPAAKILSAAMVVFAIARWRAPRHMFAVIAAFAILLRFLVPIASPNPRVDVHVMSQESAAHLLQGHNPYRTPVSDPYDGHRFGYDITGYMYPPATLYLQTIGYLLGDVRVMSALAETVAALALFLLAGGRAGGRTSQLVVLMFLAHPRGLFVVEQAWTEPMWLACLGAALLAREASRRAVSAAVYGFMVSAKQSLIFLGGLWLMLERNPRHLAIGVLVAMATLVPFALWDAESFWRNAVFFHFDTGYRTDTLTIFAPLTAAFGVMPTRWWTIGVGLTSMIATAVVFWRLEPVRGFLWAASITTLAMFVLGNKAWCNYYYFTGGLMLFTVAREVNPRGEEVKGV